MGKSCLTLKVEVVEAERRKEQSDNFLFRLEWLWISLPEVRALARHNDINIYSYWTWSGNGFWVYFFLLYFRSLSLLNKLRFLFDLTPELNVSYSHFPQNPSHLR